MNENGRVNILNPNNNTVFNLYDKIPVVNKSSNYREALTGNLESTTLSDTFFLLKIYFYYSILLLLVYIKVLMVDIK